MACLNYLSSAFTANVPSPVTYRACFPQLLVGFYTPMMRPYLSSPSEAITERGELVDKVLQPSRPLEVRGQGYNLKSLGPRVKD
jgi:hypothetical protein